jgi:hypothetical protein
MRIINRVTTPLGLEALSLNQCPVLDTSVSIDRHIEGQWGGQVAPIFEALRINMAILKSSIMNLI